jgi:glyoxylase-like metal-dependent hydrolase (beta-lactamase superfamily II)
MLKRHLSATLSSVVLALSALGSTLIVTEAVAQTALTKSQPGYHRMTVGSLELIALSDGTVPLDTAVLAGSAPSEIKRLLDKAFVQSPLDASVNAFLIKGIGDRLILVDAGTAELYGPSLEKLPAVLRRIGYPPEQITDILVTHIHTDHTGGLMEGNTRVFPNAKIHVEKKEVDYWMSAANKAAAPDNQKIYFDQAALKFKPYLDSGQVVPFSGATQLFPGLSSKPSPGHTPGHTFYTLENGGQKVVFIGDVLHVQEVQFPNPAVTIQFDVDPDAARATRKQVFAEAAQQKYLVAAPHLAFPGVGHIARGAPDSGVFVGSDRLYKEVGEYRFYPVVYKNDAVFPN